PHRRSRGLRRRSRYDQADPLPPRSADGQCSWPFSRPYPRFSSRPSALLQEDSELGDPFPRQPGGSSLSVWIIGITAINTHIVIYYQLQDGRFLIGVLHSSRAQDIQAPRSLYWRSKRPAQLGGTEASGSCHNVVVTTD